VSQNTLCSLVVTDCDMLSSDSQRATSSRYLKAIATVITLPPPRTKDQLCATACEEAITEWQKGGWWHLADSSPPRTHQTGLFPFVRASWRQYSCNLRPPCGIHVFSWHEGSCLRIVVVHSIASENAPQREHVLDHDGPRHSPRHGAVGHQPGLASHLLLVKVVKVSLLEGTQRTPEYCICMDVVWLPSSRYLFARLTLLNIGLRGEGGARGPRAV